MKYLWSLLCFTLQVYVHPLLNIFGMLLLFKYFIIIHWFSRKIGWSHPLGLSISSYGISSEKGWKSLVGSSFLVFFHLPIHCQLLGVRVWALASCTSWNRVEPGGREEENCKSSLNDLLDLYKCPGPEGISNCFMSLSILAAHTQYYSHSLSCMNFLSKKVWDIKAT